MELWGWAQLLTNNPTPFISVVVGLHFCIRHFALHLMWGLDAAAQPGMSHETLSFCVGAVLLNFSHLVIAPWYHARSCWARPVLSQMLKAVRMAGCLNLHTCCHGGEWNAWCQWFKWFFDLCKMKGAQRSNNDSLHMGKKDAFLAFNHVRRQRDNQQQLGQLEQKAGWSNSTF